MTVEQINKMSHFDMAKHYRFAASGVPEFRAGTPECDAFSKRFKAFGGMTPELSKAIGW